MMEMTLRDKKPPAGRKIATETDEVGEADEFG